MFKYESQYLHPVRVDRPNPHYAILIQQQLGGPQGELKAAMQYFAQSFRIKDKEIKDLFLDIATEELCHLEMIAQLVNLLNGDQPCCQNAQMSNVEPQILTGLIPVSYTHLDVYKRQGNKSLYEDNGLLSNSLIFVRR